MASTTGPFVWARRAVRNYGARAAIQLCIAVANFGLVQVVGRVLPTTEFGRYALLLALNALVLSFLTQPVSDALMRHLHGSTRDGQRPEVQRSIAMFGLAAVATACVAYSAVVLVLWTIGTLPSSVTTGLIVAAPCFFSLYCMTGMTSTYFNSSARYRWYLFTGFGVPATSIAALIISVHLFGRSALHVVAAQIIVYVLALTGVIAPRLPTFRKLAATMLHPRGPLQRATDRMLFAYIIPMPVLYLANYGDRWLVANFFSLRELGQYSYVTVLTANITFVLFNVSSAALYLHAVERMAEAGTSEKRKAVARRYFWMAAGFPLLLVPLLPIYILYEQGTVHLIFGAIYSAPWRRYPQALCRSSWCRLRYLVVPCRFRWWQIF